MRVLLTLLTSIALFAGGCGGGGDVDKIFPYRSEVHDLPNGLRTVLVDSGYDNLVALYVIVQTGSRNEVEPGRSGFAHLFEHMMFRGTERFPSEEWEAIMQAAGAETNAYTSDDHTAYHAVFASEDLEKILELEADRFQNLEYSEEVFRTETRAVLGEYNKSFANPFLKLDEVMRETAFAEHTYRHTTIGFLEDIENMPEMYDYGLQFFDRYYRPEYTMVAIVGDFDFGQAREMVERYWGGWERGSYSAPIPSEPPQNAPKTVDAEFHAPTLPLVAVAHHAPAYDDEAAESAVLDIISFYAFGENSDLYQRLVLEEQKVDALFPSYYDHVDPFLFQVVARVKDPADVPAVEQALLETFEQLRDEPPPEEELEAVKDHLRYDFALSMNSTSSIARTLAHYLSLRRTPETINKRYRLYAEVTPQDVQETAAKYFTENGRVIARLEHAADDQGETE